MTAIKLYESNYKADLTALKGPTKVGEMVPNQTERQWADETAKHCKRTDYYDLSHDEVRIINEWTREKFTIDLFILDWEGVVDRLGLILAPVEYIYDLDDDGVPKVDGEGVKTIKDTIYSEVKFKCKVKAVGLSDYNGKMIEPGTSVEFGYIKQATNRPLVDSNWKDNVLPRIPAWMLNGETLIKDSNDTGISEQHTCVARAVQILTGVDGITPTNSDMQKFAINGIHPLASITADTGKANTGADIFGSDPEIVPVDILLTFDGYHGIVPGELLKQPIAKRAKLCNTVQASAKLIMLRCGARDVNASLGNGQAATRRAHILTTRVLPDLDDLSAMVTEYISTMGFRTTPISATHLTAALAMWFLKDAEQINTCPRDNVKAFDGGIPLEEAPMIRFDLEKVKPFLLDLRESNSVSKLNLWTKTRLGKKNLKPNEKFGQVVRIVMAFFDEADIATNFTKDEFYAPHLLNSSEAYPKGCGVATKTGQPDAKEYLHFGGADRGPWAKPAKEEAEEVAA